MSTIKTLGVGVDVGGYVKPSTLFFYLFYTNFNNSTNTDGVIIEPRRVHGSDKRIIVW